MPAKSFLRSEQVDKLQKSLRESELPHVRERILILLLQNDGKTQRGIAALPDPWLKPYNRLQTTVYPTAETQ